MKGFYSMGLCGYEVEIAEDNESVLYKFVGTEKEHKMQKSKIRYTQKDARPYFLANGRRIHLDQCLRMGI